MLLLTFWTTLAVFFGVGRSLFVPDQLPSLLSFLYSNIPPIRKGHDSRVGVGFRLGNNADFQVQVELGPQESTLPVGQDAASKRHIEPFDNFIEDTPWIYRWKQVQKKRVVKKPVESKGVSWAAEPPRLDNDVIRHLSQLYKKKT